MRVTGMPDCRIAQELAEQMAMDYWPPVTRVAVRRDPNRSQRFILIRSKWERGQGCAVSTLEEHMRTEQVWSQV